MVGCESVQGYSESAVNAIMPCDTRVNPVSTSGTDICGGVVSGRSVAQLRPRGMRNPQITSSGLGRQPMVSLNSRRHCMFTASVGHVSLRD